MRMCEQEFETRLQFRRGHGIEISIGTMTTSLALTTPMGSNDQMHNSTARNQM